MHGCNPGRSLVVSLIQSYGSYFGSSLDFSVEPEAE